MSYGLNVEMHKQVSTPFDYLNIFSKHISSPGLHMTRDQVTSLAKKN